MIKRIWAIILCCVFLLLCGCHGSNKKYKRISFKSEALGEEWKVIDDNTVIKYNSDETFVSQMPIYEIEERPISDQECRQMMENLGFPDTPDEFEHEGNSISIRLVEMLDTSRGYYDATEEELEKMAWEAFNKIPFIEGEYEYYGIRGEDAIEDADGKHIISTLVSFFPVLDGVRVIGNNRCDMWFDGSGLVEIRIRMYTFKNIGTMDLLPLADAKAKLNKPDDFDVDDTMGTADTLCVNRVKLLWINQYSDGCSILQPVYNFTGTATSTTGYQAEFKSKVIAIPEAMTYEEE